MLPIQKRVRAVAAAETPRIRLASDRQLFAFFSRNLMASPTVRMVSAASSGISQPNSSSKAITSSTVSRLSAPRSSMKLAFSVTLSGSTPRCSTTIFFTRSPISLIVPTSSCNATRQARFDFCPNTSLNLPTAVGRHRFRGGRSARRSGIPAPPTRVRFGYHTSKRLTSAPASRPRHLLPRSNHGHSAIHMQRLAGHVAGLVGGEKHDRRSDLGRDTRAACRNFCDDGFPLLVVELVRHRRDDESRRHTICVHLAHGIS